MLKTKGNVQFKISWKPELEMKILSYFTNFLFVQMKPINMVKWLDICRFLHHSLRG